MEDKEKEKDENTTRRERSRMRGREKEERIGNMKKGGVGKGGRDWELDGGMK